MTKRFAKATDDHMLANSENVTVEQITQAYNAGMAVLRHHYSDGLVATELMLDGEHYDTRGQGLWDEAWATHPGSLKDCLDAARY